MNHILLACLTAPFEGINDTIPYFSSLAVAGNARITAR
ncbi:hypothetical protein CLV59_107145 [Chitinophaga dinghuensis]|uniref:Uncharacterized protein n=1 Tax=Chitinophaga dinghuensis TaxID=1539050 RepID=A0A327VTU0_9BACT|nr:hypothetical protein CLV59_107145 [Chitinophaga dinghuensis]